MDSTRPDDRELVRRAVRVIRQRTGADVVFGGLRQGRSIPVQETAGAKTGTLTSIRVQPSKGLGGLTWVSRKPLTVAEYGGAREITHEFDPQILGEGIRQLTAAPVVVGGEVRGLLYLGQRDAEPATDAAGILQSVTGSVASELRLRDLVDERVALREPDASGLSARVRAELLDVLRTTRDQDTARRLRLLLQEPAAVEADVALTPRQRQVLELVAKGLSNQQIGDRLALSQVTVKSYMRAIMTRLGARSRLQAVTEAQRRGLL
ncbi:hypothetical protein LK09_19715 [Microbacterium mangrovi]|uniref:HTH luxR-type domain-containing protein n=1 Tax=Microbacterium mangrovi TaxID=1348253 RepID=A0A0B2A105_9MICO|nr:LuxR C-terminal-related transcriptional regulator [Microbacterium mangrovi]KHK95240.1 hypothetical protein LK09_19715 [Microbacterium mangrovi]